MTRTIDQMIASEILCCMSSLVATLANRPDDGPRLRTAAGSDLADLCWQAIELAAPVDDWEETAIQAGWHQQPAGDWRRDWKPEEYPNYGGIGFFIRETALTACLCDSLDPVQAEVYEHWAVTDWFADKLEAAGEKIDRDFAGLCVWARTTTGQSMTMDGVIQRIYAQTHTGLEG